MTFFHWFIGALACYRLTVLIARDAGPWRIFSRLRENDRYSKLLKCPYCVSVWCGALVATFQFYCGIETGMILLLIVFSYSAIAICADRIFTSDHQAK